MTTPTVPGEHRPTCDALGCSVSCPVAAMRDAMRKAADDLDGIIAVRAVTDTTRRIAHDLRAALAAAEGEAE